MRQRLLGKSGLRVSELCLGTMTFGTEWGWGADEAACREIYTAFRQAGGTFIDTANLYTNGASEEIVGRLVADERDSIVLATKYTMTSDRSDLNAGGSHRKSLRRSLEASLRRLGTDYVDVLWVHAWDQCTPVEETLRALDDVVRSGRVLAIGVSNTPAWVVSRSDAIAELRGWSSYCGVQLEYSLLARTADRELLPMARELGLAPCAWSPLAMGMLSGRAAQADAPSAGRQRSAQASPSQQTVIDLVAEIAAELGTSSAQVAIAWVLEQGLLPVLGARTPAQIRDNLASLAIQFDESQLERLDAATRPDLGYPHEFLRDRWSILTPGGLNGAGLNGAGRAGAAR
jgi:aryl-alcohol dehydrogenase-like predicted oxidoreductase